MSGLQQKYWGFHEISWSNVYEAATYKEHATEFFEEASAP
jgi:hypothetical protein